MSKLDKLFALGLIIFVLLFILIWKFFVTPVCDELGWKPPCPPKDFTSLSDTL